jgi:DNA-binding response OmpR family regulator
MHTTSACIERYDARGFMTGSVLVHDAFSGRAAARSARTDHPGPRGEATRGTALLVEDDDAVRRMVDRHLTRAGFTVRVAGTDRDALREAPGSDVIILDLGLTEGDGAVVCDLLRDDPATADVPIIVLTARDDLATKLRLFASGADDYVTKPFEPLELIARIDAATRRSALPGEWRRLGPLAINGNGDATLNDQVLPFTAAERDLMSRLTDAFPGTASHESLRHGAWRRSDTASANVIEVVVARIRKKIAAAGGGVEIRAVRGAGYVMRIGTQDRERTGRS